MTTFHEGMNSRERAYRGRLEDPSGSDFRSRVLQTICSKPELNIVIHYHVMVITKIKIIRLMIKVVIGGITMYKVQQS